MFRMFLDGLSYQQIADQLNNAGIRTILGNLFQEQSVRHLVINEVYAGNMLRQKTHIPDPISKVKVRNNGDLPQYLYSNSHEAIIDPETYQLVQEEMKRRAGMVNPTYFFTGRIRCECCGSHYTRKKGIQRGKTYIHWICRSKKESGKTCTSENFTEDGLIKICQSVVGADYADRIKEMRVDREGNIHFSLTGGEEKVWNNLHLHSYRHIHTVTDAFLGKIICGKRGTVYHRTNGNNRWCYWKCYGRQKHICDNVNYTDHQLRIITAAILETPDFDENTFADQIDRIVVLDGSSLRFIFKDGSDKVWKEL